MNATQPSTNAFKALPPFLKWAGGKRWLTDKFPQMFPRQYRRYLEPFLGGGAVFFYLCPERAIISDRNPELVNAYIEVKNNWRSVQRTLEQHQREHSRTYYYSEREKIHNSPHEKAAQLIYLNRTCWNGLYRVNLNGKFNVPIGTKTSVILDSDDFFTYSKILSKAEICCSDFESIIDRAQKSDFVFIDPPYVTRHNYNGFLKYNEILFTWSDQVRLANSIKRAANRGSKILVTNADHPSIRELYENFSRSGTVSTLLRSSKIAADSRQRGLVTEIAVTINYEPLL